MKVSETLRRLLYTYSPCNIVCILLFLVILFCMVKISSSGGWGKIIIIFCLPPFALLSLTDIALKKIVRIQSTAVLWVIEILVTGLVAFTYFSFMG